MTDPHVAVLHRALTWAPEPSDRRLLREVLYELLSARNAATNRQATAALLAESEPSWIEGDRVLVEVLVSKGIMHNGLVPDLTGVEVQRAINHVHAALLSRRPLDPDAILVLDDVFDHATAHPGASVQLLRTVERQVRSGLGLEQRLAWNPDQLPLS